MVHKTITIRIRDLNSERGPTAITITEATVTTERRCREAGSVKAALAMVAEDIDEDSNLPSERRYDSSHKANR